MSLLEIDGLCVSFGGIRALDRVSLRVEEGEILALIGPNGAGKSTLFNLISAMYRPDAGAIRFAGEDLLSCPPHAVALRGIARTFQNIELFEQASLLQNLVTGMHRHRRTGLLAEFLFTPAARRQELAWREAAERVIDLLDLQPWRERSVASLPYGVRKRVELGRALVAEPRLLLLDEPAAGLSLDEKRDMEHRIGDIRRTTGAAILMVEHDMGMVARVSDRVVVLADGRVLAEGPAERIQRHPDVIAALFGGETIR